jgi:hypothetical protein
MKKGPGKTGPSPPQLNLSLYRDRGGLCVVTEKITQIEAVAEAGGEDPRIQISVGPHARTIPMDLRVEPRLLDVGVEIPAATERDVEARLKREADGIVDVDAPRAGRFWPVPSSKKAMY